METRLSDVNFSQLTAGRSYFPSPTHWEDEVLYFLLADRFSDGRETNYLDNSGFLVQDPGTPLFGLAARGNAVTTESEAAAWRDAGARFVGGTLAGITSKLGYLTRLGITAIWISPIFKQVASQETYHGYGIQNFLDVDPRFGTALELVELVRTAHHFGIRVVLDIILNHTGDVFDYAPESALCPVNDDQGNELFKSHCWQSSAAHTYPVVGFRDQSGAPNLPFGPVDLAHFPDGAIWPAEFQSAETFTRKGEIKNFDHSPEFREGDFFSLKDVHLGSGPVDAYRPSAALHSLCQVFKYWIAFADLDGFRVDTVKHMDDGASRFFTSVIHEFAESLGKENFYLIAEITGGRANAVNTLEIVGMNAALGIDDIPDRVEYLVKGYRDPESYFGLFRNSELIGKGSHTWFRNKIVNTLDDHDQVRKGHHKSRFAHDEGPGQEESFRGSLAALALLTTTMGIPCIYYGTEQQFDGHGNNGRFIREAMFGGDFGAFRSRGHHFFNEGNCVFRELGKILALRRQEIVIRRGRQFLRPISGNGIDFGLPRMLGNRMLSVVAWSRLFNDREVVIAINTDFDRPTTAWVTIDDTLHPAGTPLTCAYSSDGLQVGQQVAVEARNGKAVLLTVPAAGVVIFR